jgi:hypothetical protein
MSLTRASKSIIVGSVNYNYSSEEKIDNETPKLLEPNNFSIQ